MRRTLLQEQTATHDSGLQSRVRVLRRRIRLDPLFHRRTLVLAFTLYTCLHTGLADMRLATAGDPRQVWKTVETEHFIIHYDEPLFEVAEKVARVAERGHAVLVPIFAHAPAKKTHIVILDQTDSSNGFASVLPYNRITLYATAPEADSVLSDHDDWLYYLTTHEYTHILHLDTIDGLAKLSNKIVGKQWAPNQVLPRWVIEGLATYEESRQTSGGRTRSAIFDMNLRAVTLADERLDLDAVTNGPVAWPRGTAAYLYGSHFLEYIFDRYGDDKVRELTWDYGSNPIPYSLQRTITRLVGKDFDALYEEWLEHLRGKYSLQAEAVERLGLREGRRLTFSRESNVLPRYTEDGRAIVWSQADAYTEARLRVMPVGQNVGRAGEYVDIDRIGDYDLLADGSIVASVRNSYRAIYSYDDLYLWHRGERRLERLTFGLRAREPAVSPDGSQIAFVVNARSQTRLALMPLRPHADHRVLWQGERFDQVSHPDWSPDGRSIAVSTWSKGGYRDIRVIDVATGSAERVTGDRANDLYPVFSPDGAYLYFVSDRTGIFNIYALDLRSRETWQVTNVLGGTFSFDVSPDGKRLVYTGFGVGGYDIYEIDLDPAAWIEPVPYINDRPDPAFVPEEDVIVAGPKPYRPLATLAPKTYSLGLAAGSFGTALTVQTIGSDVVGLHSYQLGATVELARADVNFGLFYSYSRLWPSLAVAMARNVSRRSGIFIDDMNTEYVLDIYSVSAGLSFPVLRELRGSAQFSFDYDFDWSRNLEDEYQGPDPGESLPRFPEFDSKSAGVGLRFSYSDTQNLLYIAGAGLGHALAGSLRIDHPVLGSDVRALNLSYSWQGYKTLPWLPSTSLSVRLSGGISTSDRARQTTYVLGGVPDQSIATAIIQNRRASTTGYLRGFPARHAAGLRSQLVNVEFRKLLYDVERGASTLPFYLRRLHMAALLDVGDAWVDAFDVRNLNVGLGASLRLDMSYGYYLGGSLDLGYARGLTAGGINEYWLLFTGSI